MSSEIDSSALLILNRALGLAGVGSQTSILDDGNVNLVMEISEIVRRSRSLAGTTGWFTCIMRNSHPAAGALNTTVNPYNVAGGSNTLPYPDPVPIGLDFWILGASCARNAGTGTLDGGVLQFAPDNLNMGWGIEDDGTTPIILAGAIDLAFWDGWDTSTGQPVGQNSISGATYQRIMMRIPRGVGTLRWFSDVAGAAADADVRMVCALLPESLGQDIAS